MSIGYSEADVVKDKFIFVSYQHNDMTLVESSISKLTERGVRIWFDADLDFGDNWRNRVNRIITHENCCGVIFFCSTTAFRSEPIYYERSLVKTEIKKRGQDKFFYIPVNIGKPHTLQILREIFLHSPEASSELEKYINHNQIAQILEMFNSHILSCYADCDKFDDFINQLYTTIEKNHPEVIRSQELKLKKLKSIQSDKSFLKHGKILSVKLGNWLGNSITAMGSGMTNTKKTSGGKTVFHYKDCEYASSPLMWLLLSFKDESAVLISDSILDIRSADSDIQSWLDGEFSKLAFSEEEADIVSGNLRLLGLGDADISENASLFANPKMSPVSDTLYWWINCKAFGNSQKVIKVKDGTVYNGGIMKNKAVGVRPIIEVPCDKLIKYLED